MLEQFFFVKLYLFSVRTLDYEKTFSTRELED